MSIIVCSSCKMRVMPQRDGKCPSCGFPLADPQTDDRPDELAQAVEPDVVKDHAPASPPTCVLCQAEQPTNNRVLRVGQATVGIGSVSVKQFPGIEMPMCDPCYQKGRRLQWHRMLAGMAIVPLMIGWTIGLAMTAQFFGEEHGGKVAIVYLLLGLALVLWWLFWLFPFLRRRVRGLVLNDALARRLKRMAGVDEFGLLCHPSFHPVKQHEDYVSVEQVLAMPLPTEGMSR